MLMNMYREIDRSSFQFDFVYFTADRCAYDDEIEMLGGRIVRISASGTVARFWSLYVILRRGEWSIVHSHTLFSSALHLTAARIAGVKHCVAHSHSTQDDNSQSIFGRLYQRTARWLLGQVSTCRLACGVAAAAYLFPKRQDVVTIPNAVDIDRFADASGAAVRSALQIREGQIVIVQIARFMPVKNQVRSVAIALALREAGIDFVLLLAGTGPEQLRIERLVRQHRLEDHVQLLGSRADIPELMTAADVMLMPSLYEGFPVVLVEAQAAGLPSVVSSVVAPEVDLQLGMVRFVGLDASDAQWVEAIQRAVIDPLPDAAERRRVLENLGYSSAVGVKRLVEVYTNGISPLKLT